LPSPHMPRHLITPILLLFPLFALSQTPRDITTPPQIEAEDTIGQRDLIDIFLKVTQWKGKAQSVFHFVLSNHTEPLISYITV